MTPGGPSPGAGWEAALPGPGGQSRGKGACTQARLIQASPGETGAVRQPLATPPLLACRLPPSHTEASLGSDLSFISEAAVAVTASAQEEGGSGFPPAGWGRPRACALGLQWPGWARRVLRRATHCNHKGSPKPSFIKHLLHARPLHGPHMDPPLTLLGPERWVFI